MPESMMQPDLQNVAPVNGVRAAALARWQERGWPGVKDEAWRFTRLAALDKLSLRPADTSLADGIPALPADMLPAGAHVIRFHDGVLVTDSLSAMPAGISATPISEDDLGAIVDIAPTDHPVTDLSVAAMTSGLSLDVAAATSNDRPLVIAATDKSVTGWSVGAISTIAPKSSSLIGVALIPAGIALRLSVTNTPS